MTGRTRFGPNVIDTENLYDASVTTAKLGADVVAGIAALSTAITANTVLAQKTVTHGGGAKQLVGTLLTGSLVTACIMYISETWNGSSATVHVGHDGSSQFDYFLPDVSFSPTAGAVIGNDPKDCGIGLYIPGVQTTTASSWGLSALHVDGTSHNMDSHTQATTAGDYTVTTWPRRITTYVDPTFDASIYAYVTPGAGHTTGKALVTLFGVQGGGI